MVRIEDRSTYYSALKDEIDKRMKSLNGKSRAVIVFFKTEASLRNFAKYTETTFEPILLTTAVTPVERDTNIKKAAQSGSVTFATREYGRGVDFVCRDPAVEVRYYRLYVMVSWIVKNRLFLFFYHLVAEFT